MVAGSHRTTAQHLGLNEQQLRAEVNVIKVFRISTSKTAPRLTRVDASGRPEDWVRGVNLPEVNTGKYKIVDEVIDRPPLKREFCALVPGTLVLSTDNFEDESGATSMWYALRWETQRIDLRAAGAYYAAVVP